MARNRIQFQKGLSEALFLALYGNEEQCRPPVVAWRWQGGFRCPKCGGQEHCIVGPRRLFQCNACRRQTSPMAGTIFNSTKLPLTVWFRAMYLVTQTKQGISSIELGRRLGVTQTTAWKIKTKLAEVMRAGGDEEKLAGRIEMDDAYLGGERSGGNHGRGRSNGREGSSSPHQAAAHRALQAPPREIADQADHNAGINHRHRRLSMLSRCCGRRLHARPHHDGLRPAGGPPPSIQVGEHYAGKHQSVARRHLSRDPQEARGPLSRRVRMALQQSLRSRCHDPRSRTRRRDLKTDDLRRS